jgi:hypothetical protein
MQVFALLGKAGKYGASFYQNAIALPAGLERFSWARGCVLTKTHGTRFSVQLIFGASIKGAPAVETELLNTIEFHDSRA